MKIVMMTNININTTKRTNEFEKLKLIKRRIFDLIVLLFKQKKGKEYNGVEADEESPMLEEVVAPSK